MNNHSCLECKHKFKKRIKNDIILIECYKNVTIEKCEENNDKYFIYIKINKKKYLFKLKHDYPFSAPEILIKIDNKYIDYYEYIFHIYKFYKNKVNTENVTCPCCFNLLCEYNLNNKLINFLDEIINYNNLIIQLSNKYFGKILLNKKNNLNDNINYYIIDYL
tara:strand:- start:805 stop:1293 length:489 start_codon:yes stop_codon:yes gene_type:complete